MASEKTIARLEAQIQRRVAHCLQFELSDPRTTFVTVTGVSLSKDLSQATIQYSVLGDESACTKTAHMLRDASGFVRRQLGRVLHTRSIPQLRWEYDPSIVEAARISKLIDDARRKDRGLAPGADAPDAEVDDDVDARRDEEE